MLCPSTETSLGLDARHVSSYVIFTECVQISPWTCPEGSLLQTCFLCCLKERNQLRQGCCYMDSVCSWGMRSSFPRALQKQTPSKAQAMWIVVTASSSLTVLIPLRFSPLQDGSLGEMVTVGRLPVQQPLTCTWEAGRSPQSTPMI